MSSAYDIEAGPSDSGGSRGRRRSIRFQSTSTVIDGRPSDLVAPIAGPSRLRGGSSTDPVASPPTATSSSRNSRPASPSTAFAATFPHSSPSTASPPQPAPPHLDLPTYPTPTLLKLLASLLHQIATANDALRPDLDDQSLDVEVIAADEEPPPSIRGDTPASEGTGTGTGTGSARGSTTSSRQPHPSPTTALFTDAPVPTAPPPDPALNTDQFPLFTASRTSLNHPSSLLSFHARHIPTITIEAYLLRILKYCPTTNEVFLGLLVYFDRMSRLGTASGVGGVTAAGKGRGFAIDSFNVHRLVIAGVTVASKFFSDVFYTNSRYAKVGGLPPHELNQLELQFLLLNDFRLAIPPEEMQRYGDRLLAYWEGREGEIGIDVHSGRELSEGSRARASRNSPRRSQAPAPASAPPPAPSPEAKVEVRDAMDVDPPASTPAPALADGLPSQPATEVMHAADSTAPPPVHPPSAPPSSTSTMVAENGSFYAPTPTATPPAKPTSRDNGHRQNGLGFSHVEGAGGSLGVVGVGSTA